MSSEERHPPKQPIAPVPRGPHLNPTEDPLAQPGPLPGGGRLQHVQHAQHKGSAATSSSAHDGPAAVYMHESSRADTNADLPSKPAMHGGHDAASGTPLQATAELSVWSDQGAWSDSVGGSGPQGSGPVFVPPENLDRASGHPTSANSSQERRDSVPQRRTSDIARMHGPHAGRARRLGSGSASHSNRSRGEGSREHSMPQIPEDESSMHAHMSNAADSVRDALSAGHTHLSPRPVRVPPQLAPEHPGHADPHEERPARPASSFNISNSPFDRDRHHPATSAAWARPPVQAQALHRSHIHEGETEDSSVESSVRHGFGPQSASAAGLSSRGRIGATQQAPQQQADMHAAPDNETDMNQLTLLEQKRVDNMTAEYSAVIASYESSRQAAHNRNAIFSGLMSAAIAVATDREDETRSFLAVCGIATCVYWSITLHRDHFMAVKRLNHGVHIEAGLEAVFMKCRNNELRDPPQYFKVLKDGYWYKAVAKDCKVCCCPDGRCQCVGLLRRWLRWQRPLQLAEGVEEARRTGCASCRRCTCCGEHGCCRSCCLPTLDCILLLLDVHFHFCLLVMFVLAWLYVLVLHPASSRDRSETPTPG